MKINKAVIAILMLSFLSGCYYIGVERVGPNPSSVHRAAYSNYSFLSNVPRQGVVCFNNISTEESNIYASNSTAIVTILGEPSASGEFWIRYNTNRRSWKGCALDLAIFPLPLTIPLMVPAGKEGYIEFRFDERGIAEILEYRTTAAFYGFWADDSGGGFSKGEAPGLWFN